MTQIRFYSECPIVLDSLSPASNLPCTPVVSHRVRNSRSFGLADPSFLPNQGPLPTPFADDAACVSPGTMPDMIPLSHAAKTLRKPAYGVSRCPSRSSTAKGCHTRNMVPTRLTILLRAQRTCINLIRPSGHSTGPVRDSTAPLKNGEARTFAQDDLEFKPQCC